jgi:hypothetical protein
LSAPQNLSVQTRRTGEQPGVVVNARSSQGPATRDKTSALINAAVRARVRAPRGFVALDVAIVAGALPTIVLVFLSLLAFVLVKDERAADRDRAELVLIAESCLAGWEQTINDLNVCTDIREEQANATFGMWWWPPATREAE